MSVNEDVCEMCYAHDESSDVQNGLCASCFEAMPEGVWVNGGHK